MPQAERYQSNMYVSPKILVPATWSLLKRDDGGTVFLQPEKSDCLILFFKNHPGAGTLPARIESLEQHDIYPT